MTTIKSYTDLEQSKKLAKILPLESADYTHFGKNDDNIIARPYLESCSSELNEWVGKENLCPCWSLASLLEILEYPQLSKDKLGGGKEGWMVSVYPNDCRYDSCWYSNPVDACVELLLKLNELNLL